MRAVQGTLHIFLLFTFVVASGCAVNPVTGQREITLMSEAQEIQLGASSDASIVAQYGAYEDPALQAYIAQLGEAMVPVSHRPNLDFEFRLLDDPIVNAFALPGGYVYITRGILAYLHSEAALAGVMGHEIGHVTAKHGVQRYTQQTLVGVGLGVGSILSETFAQYSGLAGTAAQLMLLKYGRDDERQSDQLGVEYATKLGYDTADMAEFFRTLKRLSPADGRLPSWASTHPDPGERTETVYGLTREWQGQQPGPFRTDRDDYLRRIDGLVFGPDPQQGFVRAGIFHHPGLEFRFPVPTGYAVQNGKSQVVLIAPEQAAAVIFMAADGATPEAAADAFLQELQTTARSRESLPVAGGSGVRTLVLVAGQDGQNQVILSTFFRFGGQTWVFHGLCAPEELSAREAELTQSADGFGPETDPAILATEPFVIQIVPAPRAGSFQNAVSAWPLPEGCGLQDVDDLAILNGMERSTAVQAGELLKVIARRGAGGS